MKKKARWPDEKSKQAEEQRERLRQLEADLAHIDRVSIVGELAASSRMKWISRWQAS